MKRHAPATARNSGPIAKVLEAELPTRGLVLEIASGTGEHAVFMAHRFPALDWQPTDPDTDALSSIAAYAADSGLGNLREPFGLDATSRTWPLDNAAAIVCINMVHISPWAASEGLFAGASRLLGEGSPLLLYGPYLEDDIETAQSNIAFDASLKSRNTSWGLRSVTAMDELAAAHAFSRTARHEMPANNLILVYRRT